jgi:serine/threonine-protein kinase
MTSLPDDTVAHLRRLLGWPMVAGGRYQALDVVGQGGMGVVYRATDQVLGRDVALKVLRPDVADDTLADRLRREARILAHLEHPGVVPIHDAGVLEDGRVFYVMKLVRGVRLDEFTAGRTRGETLRLFVRLLDTIGFAHSQGVIHRDLKPSNIMVGAFGEVIVLDWGIARLLAAEEPARASRSRELAGAEAVTSPGMVLGTPGFMAPEQAGGAAAADQRADVFALGMILQVIALPGGVPRPLQSIIARATAKRPEERYPSVADLAAEVARFLDGGPVAAHRESVWERVGRLYFKYQTAILLVLAYLTLRLLFLVWRGL